MVKSYCTVDQPEFEESFEQAKTRLELSDTQLKDAKSSYLRLALFYLFFAFCMIGYALYLLAHDQVLAVMMCVPILMVLLAFFFRHHFWYTQIKQERLGMSVKQWFLSLIFGVTK